MIIVTAGGKYLDIDAYAGCMAYAELLNAIGRPARAVSTAIVNKSVPAVVRAWNAPLTTTYAPSAEDRFTLIDVSNPDYFEKFVDMARIDEVIDHHPGHEAFWQARIGDGATIEWVGAACTQVAEKWVAARRINDISQTSARLLMYGILDNTLNFGADVTTDRDRQAYALLAKYADLPSDWPARYFSACQEEILADIARAVADDTKIIDSFKTFAGSVAVGSWLCGIPNLQLTGLSTNLRSS